MYQEFDVCISILFHSLMALSKSVKMHIKSVLKMLTLEILPAIMNFE